MSRNDMTLEEIFDELGTIVSSLDNLIEEIHFNDYKESLKAIRDEANIEKDDVDKQLQDKEDEEARQMEKEFINERIWLYGRNKCKRHNSNDGYRIN